MPDTCWVVEDVSCLKNHFGRELSQILLVILLADIILVVVVVGSDLLLQVATVVIMGTEAEDWVLEAAPEEAPLFGA